MQSGENQNIGTGSGGGFHGKFKSLSLIQISGFGGLVQLRAGASDKEKRAGFFVCNQSSAAA
jgi:hypothetical protein